MSRARLPTMGAMAMDREHRRFTLDEYLHLERASDGPRCEWVDGAIFAMTGGSMRHSKITVNLTVAVGSRTVGKPCQPYNGDLRILIEKHSLATYPDLSIVCGTPHCRVPGPADTLLNPTALFEVLSPSTAAFDSSPIASRSR